MGEVIMKRHNPFTPSFGGKPKHFFGRESILLRVSSTLSGDDSPDRILFITGPRGCGKTALLEQLSQVAASHRWMVIDVHSSDTVHDIMAHLDKNHTPTSVSLAPKISVLGTDVSFGEAKLGSSQVSSGLTQTLLDTCASLKTKSGVFITIDEIQKISEDDMECICAAVQMAKRKGYPIALMMAGLPGSKKKVASYAGCTFMQRVKDERIASLLIDETIAAFKGLCNRVSQFEIDDAQLYEAAAFSQGYPYLIQLVGYHLVELADAEYPVGVAKITMQDINVIQDEVYATYRDNVLMPSTGTLKGEGRAYLAAMAKTMDEEGVASTGDVAAELGKTTTQLSSCRQNLIERRLVIPVGYGKVRFGLPHLSRFAVERVETVQKTRAGEWPIK